MGEAIALGPVTRIVGIGNRVFDALRVSSTMRSIRDAGGQVPFARAELARWEALIQSAARRNEGQA